MCGAIYLFAESKKKNQREGTVATQFYIELVGCDFFYTVRCLNLYAGGEVTITGRKTALFILLENG